MTKKQRDNESGQADIQSGLIRIAYNAVPQSLLAILISSTILSVIQWNYIDHVSIILWFSFINGLSVLRYAIYKKFSIIDIDAPVAECWGNFIFISTVASGLGWGATAIWLFPEDDIAHQVLLAFILAGMSAGAVATLSSLFSSLVAFIILALLPIIIRFLTVGTEDALSMALMASIFIIILIRMAQNLNQTIKDTLMIRYEQRLANEVIEHQALYDPLTDLPNRRLLVEKIRHEIERSIRYRNLGAVLFLDLDYFKTINDSMGHNIGDELLIQVATRLKQNLRKEDAIARVGGDEFIILLSDVGKDAENARRNLQVFADKLIQLFEKEFDIEGHTIFITSSIGVSLFPATDTTPEDLLQKSDVAMYEAKAAGRNKMRLFVPEMQELIISQREMERDLRKAIKNNELEVFYQPLYDAEDNIFCVEALVRWNHPEKGLVSPAEFIELAEKRGLIISIGAWVLEQSLRDLVLLNRSSDISMSINVSPHQFSESTFVDKMMQALDRTDADPEKVRLEITEGIVMKNVVDAIDKMKLLTEEGLCFSIDDFGTGYSSLAYLKQLPVDLLKIDKSFVMDITQDKNDAVIVETILAMAHHMDIDVIAEGVENEEVLNFLKSKGCAKFQGYYFQRPMPFAELLKLVG